MAKKVASILNALHLREARAWKVIDQHLRLDAQIPAKVSQAAAEFILKRIYPEKHIVSGQGANGEFVLKIEIENENPVASLPGNRISQYIEV